jgi:hypothetical protein
MQVGQSTVISNSAEKRGKMDHISFFFFFMDRRKSHVAAGPLERLGL